MVGGTPELGRAHPGNIALEAARAMPMNPQIIVLSFGVEDLDR